LTHIQSNVRYTRLITANVEINFVVETKEIYFNLQRVIVPRRPLIRRNLVR